MTDLHEKLRQSRAARDRLRAEMAKRAVSPLPAPPAAQACSDAEAKRRAAAANAKPLSVAALRPDRRDHAGGGVGFTVRGASGQRWGW
jgi:hypothetical protein